MLNIKEAKPACCQYLRGNHAHRQQPCVHKCLALVFWLCPSSFWNNGCFQATGNSVPSDQDYRSPASNTPGATLPLLNMQTKLGYNIYNYPHWPCMDGREGNGGIIICVVGEPSYGWWGHYGLTKYWCSALDPKVWLANTTDCFFTCILSPLRHAYM